MQIDGKGAIVTGGATGVGRATALRLARGGCSVVVNYSRSRDEAEATAAEISSLGVRGLALPCDVADDAACRALVQSAVDAFGRLDILVCSAGTTHFIPHNNLDDLNDEVWDRIYDVNVKGAFRMARAAKEPMLANGGGEIVNVSSVAAYLGSGSCIPYAVSKGALNTLTVALARALAPKIRVNGVAPGFITGRWLEQGLGRSYERTKQAFERSLPLGHVCEPDDIAQAILSLITGSDLVTGQTLVCDGGMLVAKWNAGISGQ